MRRPLSSRPRRDLYTGNNGGASATKNFAHFKSTKILHVIWKDASQVVLMKTRLQKMSGTK
ncbi:hypothetical protein B296_00006193 [Ensete ventricosum]|uniref:Uncharacterized protein n=1 Tax=Ensete ventricosum TaxID=4639 RepID=A0A427APC2_ENSVE|nr:hypothetical protein B296_00006193 [Ensete ventricosum]